MSRNMGNADRIIRAAIVAPVLIILALVVGASSVLGIIFFALAGVMLLTSAVGNCPLYKLVGLNTCPVKGRPSAG